MFITCLLYVVKDEKLYNLILNKLSVLFYFVLYSESEYFTGDISIDIHSRGPSIAKSSL